MIADAWANTGPAQSGTDVIGFFLPLVLIFLVFYFLLIRPQSKKIKDHQQQLAGIIVGDQIVTGGGLVAKVVKIIDSHKITIQIAPGVEVTALRSTVSTVLDRSKAKVKATLSGTKTPKAKRLKSPKK